MPKDQDLIQQLVEKLREVLEAARETYDLRAQKELEAQTIKEQQDRAAAVPNAKLSTLVIAWDGDDIGNAISRAERSDDLQQVGQMSQRIEAGQRAVTNWILAHNGTVAQQGGDEGCATLPSVESDDLEALRQIYKDQTGHTCTVGIGSTVSQAVDARALGKLKGKNQIVAWDENIERELELRINEPDEAEKVKGQFQDPGGVKKSDTASLKWS